MRTKTIKLLKRIMIATITLIALLAAAVFLFFQYAPQIGGKAKGERLERMQQSPAYLADKGIFENQIETNMDMGFSKMLQVSREYFGDTRDREPQVMLETRAFNPTDYERTITDSLATVTWFGHSSLLINIDGQTLLTDPVFSKRASMFSFMGPKRFNYSYHMQAADLPKIDAVLISHDHYDHLDYETMLELRDRVNRFFVPLGVGAHLEAWGIPAEHITEMDWWEETPFGESLKLTCAPTRHFSGRAIRDRNSTLWCSWVVTGLSQNLYYSGDSGYGPHFKEIGEKLGPFDFTMMECGAYSQYWDNIHMMPEETAQAHVDLRGHSMMPIHWGKFNLSLHPWKEPVERLKARADSLGVTVYTPYIGEPLTVPPRLQTSAWWQEYE